MIDSDVAGCCHASGMVVITRCQHPSSVVDPEGVPGQRVSPRYLSRILVAFDIGRVFFNHGSHYLCRCCRAFGAVSPNDGHRCSATEMTGLEW